jgi:hypothetical protein
MTLLDRFRTTLAHKHQDPAVRLAAVAEIPLDDRELIAAIAREDEDARVRCAAVAKLMDPSALATVARDDGDADVRSQALDMLRDIALEAFEGLGEAEALEAVDALNDPKVLVHVARVATRELTALRAESRVRESHGLGSIARHAASDAARLAAFERLRDRADRAELLAVAMNSEHKDTAVGAVDVFTDRAELEQIASSGRNRSAVKRARGILREADERAAREAEETAAEARRAAADAVLSVPVAIPAGGDAPEAVPEAPDAALHPVAPPVVVAEAPAVAASEEAARSDLEQRLARLTELAAQAAGVVEGADLDAARKRLRGLGRSWHELSAGLAVDPAVAAKWEAAESRLAAREAEAKEAEARVRREALGRLHHLLGRVDQLLARPDLSLKAADRALHDLRTALAEMPLLPSNQDADEVTARLKASHDALSPRVLEMREAVEWQRWANAGIQEQLIAKMEALRDVEAPDAIAAQVRELQRQWREAADVPRAQADALWRRFKAAHDVVWPRVEAHFAAEAQARAENLARKIALCEKAEALAESSNWIQTADEIKRLQAEWKAIGPVPRGRERAVWERFRAPCDRFFTRRHEDLAQRKKAWSENLARKEALCVQAEALADSTDWEQTAAAIRQLQADWKAVGPVKKSRSEAIWQRFRAPCDRFFERYAHRHDVARAERVAAREGICTEFEALGELPDGEAPPDLLATVLGLRSRWQQENAARGVDPDTARRLDGRFSGALARVVTKWPAVFAGSQLDPDANRKRMEALVRKVEDLVASVAGPAAALASDAPLSPTNRLAAMLKEALAANTIGGKVDEESRWRAAAEDVRHAQAAWARLGAVPEDARHALAERFQRACRRILQRGSAGRPDGSGRSEGRPDRTGPKRMGA